MTTTLLPTDMLSIADDMVRQAKSQGADHVEVVFVKNTESAIEVRGGHIENTNYSNSTGIGIRVIKNKQSATVSGSDLSGAALKELTMRAMAIAEHVPHNIYAELPDPSLLEMNPEYDLGGYQKQLPLLDELSDYALRTETEALSHAGITNSEGASCSLNVYSVGLVTSGGFAGSYQKTMFGLSCSLIAGKDTNMQADYDYSTACLFSKLDSPENIGKNAALRTVKKLNPRKMTSMQAPIIFEPRAGRSLLAYFSGAICGDDVVRQTSFLGDARGQKIFSDQIVITDNPHLYEGLASSPFDMEGVKNPSLRVVEDGVLQHLLSHQASSMQLGVAHNGRATRSLSSIPSVASTNMYMEAGTLSPAELMSDIKIGLYVTDTIGHGINEVTGDYSVGATGFLIENGILTHPISEITIAGNLKDMFLHMTPANDLEFKARKNVPTLRVEGMTIAGE